MCSFSIPFSGTANALVSKLSSGVSGNGGTFNGNDAGGNFEVPTPLGKVAGMYTIEGSTLNINIGQKPFLLGCGQIENFLKSYLVTG
jgi:hypothetical protein